MGSKLVNLTSYLMLWTRRNVSNLSEKGAMHGVRRPLEGNTNSAISVIRLVYKVHNQIMNQSTVGAGEG